MGYVSKPLRAMSKEELRARQAIVKSCIAHIDAMSAGSVIELNEREYIKRTLELTSQRLEKVLLYAR